ncbi:MAG: adenosine deaminase [Spirochaetes bacterium]|nr:MAG: adenosine deaminase [Spirochaetota bacterium]RKX78373.1 MAG: adenosine deaminase [Spirochaetota bacterium]RKX94447.1 MAG: adenosine deaminase [Spirochaetota bacterium]
MGLADHKEIKNIRPNRNILQALPKIEVHRHLEGTYPIESLFRMAQKNDLDVPGDLESFKKAFQFPKNHEPDFLLFLSKFKKFWYKSIDDVAGIAYDSVKSFADESLHYIELRFNPLHFTELTGLNPKDVTRTIIDSSNAAAAENSMEIRYLLTFNRSVQTASEMLKTYKDLLDIDLTGVVGIDLAGDEINYPPELFPDFFDVIKKDGLFKIDIHAGEVTDSKNMWVSIDQLHTDRIGHGVAAINDKKLQNVLKEKNIFLAQCITSNYQTGAWKDEKTHPIKPLTEAGVPITLASDDPTIQDSLLVDDYEKAVSNFGWSVEDLISSNIKSIDGCFLTDKEKTDLTDSYSKAIDRFRAGTGL